MDTKSLKKTSNKYSSLLVINVIDLLIPIDLQNTRKFVKERFKRRPERSITQWFKQKRKRKKIKFLNGSKIIKIS